MLIVYMLYIKDIWILERVKMLKNIEYYELNGKLLTF